MSQNQVKRAIKTLGPLNRVNPINPTRLTQPDTRPFFLTESVDSKTVEYEYEKDKFIKRLNKKQKQLIYKVFVALGDEKFYDLIGQNTKDQHTGNVILIIMGYICSDSQEDDKSLETFAKCTFCGVCVMGHTNYIDSPDKKKRLPVGKTYKFVVPHDENVYLPCHDPKCIEQREHENKIANDLELEAYKHKQQMERERERQREEERRKYNAKKKQSHDSDSDDEPDYIKFERRVAQFQDSCCRRNEGIRCHNPCCY